MINVLIHSNFIVLSLFQILNEAYFIKKDHSYFIIYLFLYLSTLNLKNRQLINIQ